MNKKTQDFDKKGWLEFKRWQKRQDIKWYNGWVLLFWIILFWPVAIIYMMIKVSELNKSVSKK